MGRKKKKKGQILKWNSWPVPVLFAEKTNLKELLLALVKKR